MAVTENNSLVTLDEAEDYFGGRLHAEAWDTAQPTEKPKALITATRQINAMQFQGVMASVSQPHAFPRCYTQESIPDASVRYRPAGVAVCEIEIPERVKEACCEQALFLLAQSAYERKRNRDQAAGIHSMGVGSANEASSDKQVSKAQQGPRMAPEAATLLQPFIARVVNLS